MESVLKIEWKFGKNEKTIPFQQRKFFIVVMFSISDNILLRSSLLYIIWISYNE